MSSGAKQIVQYAPEASFGVTPSPFARTAIPFVDISLDKTVTKEDSNSIFDSRLAQRGAVTGSDVAGDLNVEARYGIYDELISGAAFNNWSANELVFGGATRKSFSILRGYTDITEYYTFVGNIVNTFGIDIPEQGIITMTFGFMGKDMTPSDTIPAGTVTPATSAPAMSSVSVGDILIDGVSQAGVACITAFSFNWDNTSQVQRCLGSAGGVGAIIETVANGTGSFTLAWSKKAADYYEKQFENGLIGFEIPITDSDGNSYVLEIPKAEITGALPSGSNADILQATFEYRVVEESPVLVREPFVPPIP